MRSLLLEIFSEEIPARMQAAAEQHLADALQKQCKEAGFDGLKVTRFSTPRRLAVMVDNLPTKQEDVSKELKGPKVGAPEQALAGFLKKTGLAKDRLEERDGVYFASIHQKGRLTTEVLKEAIEEILASFPWPKSMRWGSGETAWVRPLQSILCIFDGKVVPVEFAGVKAGNVTYGHRFLVPKSITIKKPEDYEKALEKAFVIADREKRKQFIKDEAEKLAKSKGYTLKDDTGLLEEVTGLVEWPVLLLGSIDAGYMDLPEEVLVSEMRNHQKYFALYSSNSPLGGESKSASGKGTPRDSVGGMAQRANPTPHDSANASSAPPQGGSLAPFFLITANIKDADKAIIAGNERVLRARLADGRFFWDTDRKKKLEDMAEGLAAVTYHAKLGSVADKVTRIEKLALELAPHVFNEGRPAGRPSLEPASCEMQEHFTEAKQKVSRAAKLCKADLTSGMAGEFPELQGVMGRYYAIEQGEPKEVAEAIAEHYLPVGPTSPVPTSPVSICVALADKLDTLVSMFAIGEKPTGSKDPFALRRAALGVIRIVLENDLRIPLTPIITNAILAAKPIKGFGITPDGQKGLLIFKNGEKISSQINPSQDNEWTEKLTNVVYSVYFNDVLNFFHDRLIVQLKDQGIRHDVIKAVIADGDDDLLRIVNRARAVQQFIDSEDGKNLLAGYKRAANIVAIEEKKDKARYDAAVDEKLLAEEPEVQLAKALAANRQKIDMLFKEEKFTDVMSLMAELRQPVDTFFDKIMVNCDKQELRANRLRLLTSIRGSMDNVANFGLIEG